jgi:acetate kinase
MSILAINSGSSSLKFGLFHADTCEPLLAGDVDWAHGDRGHAQFTLRSRNGRTVTSQMAAPDDFTAATQGNERACLAFDMFAHRVRSAIGALAATIGGVDALTFADRMGEHSAALRAAAREGLGFMGLGLDPERNADPKPDTDLARPGYFIQLTPELRQGQPEGGRVACCR